MINRIACMKTVNRYILIGLIYFQMCNPKRVLGVCLIHCTGTTAGFMESLKDKVLKP